MTQTTTLEKEQKTGIAQDDRGQVADALSVVLADTFTLYLKTHGYHWNITGPRFPDLHTFLEDQYTEMWAAVDEVAERIRALGFAAPATLGEFAKLTSVPEDGINETPDADAMLRSLLAGHEAVAREIRDRIPIAESAGDAVTADLLTQRLQAHEKHGWMIRSTLE